MTVKSPVSSQVGNDNALWLLSTDSPGFRRSFAKALQGAITGRSSFTGGEMFITTIFKALVELTDPKFRYSTEGAVRMALLPNAGGASELSEIFSYEILTLLTGCELSMTEMELKYTRGSKKTDYSITWRDQPIGVSVTRAMAFNAENPIVPKTFTREEAYRLLTKKLYGVQVSTANVVNEAFTVQILHVWCESQTAADTLESVYREEITAEERAGAVVLVTVASNERWLFLNTATHFNVHKELARRSVDPLHIPDETLAAWESGRNPIQVAPMCGGEDEIETFLLGSGAALRALFGEGSVPGSGIPTPLELTPYAGSGNIGGPFGIFGASPLTREANFGPFDAPGGPIRRTESTSELVAEVAERVREMKSPTSIFESFTLLHGCQLDNGDHRASHEEIVGVTKEMRKLLDHNVAALGGGEDEANRGIVSVKEIATHMASRKNPPTVETLSHHQFHQDTSATLPGTVKAAHPSVQYGAAHNAAHTAGGFARVAAHRMHISQQGLAGVTTESQQPVAVPLSHEAAGSIAASVTASDLNNSLATLALVSGDGSRRPQGASREITRAVDGDDVELSAPPRTPPSLLGSASSSSLCHPEKILSADGSYLLDPSPPDRCSPSSRLPRKSEGDGGGGGGHWGCGDWGCGVARDRESGFRGLRSPPERKGGKQDHCHSSGSFLGCEGSKGPRDRPPPRGKILRVYRASGEATGPPATPGRAVLSAVGGEPGCGDGSRGGKDPKVRPSITLSPDLGGLKCSEGAGEAVREAVEGEEGPQDPSMHPRVPHGAAGYFVEGEGKCGRAASPLVTSEPTQSPQFSPGLVRARSLAERFSGGQGLVGLRLESPSSTFKRKRAITFCCRH